MGAIMGGVELTRPGLLRGALVGGLAVALLIAGVSITQGMGSAGTHKLKGCVDRGSGDLRIVSGKCRGGERKVAWNKPGLAGPPGAAGARGSFDFDDFQGMQCTDDTNQDTIEVSFDGDGFVSFTC